MRYDAEVAALRASVEKVVLDLVVGPRSSVATRRAMLPHIHTLAAFIGRRCVSCGSGAQNITYSRIDAGA